MTALQRTQRNAAKANKIAVSAYTAKHSGEPLSSARPGAPLVDGLSFLEAEAILSGPKKALIIRYNRMLVNATEEQYGAVIAFLDGLRNKRGHGELAVRK